MAIERVRERRYRRYKQLREEGYDFELAWELTDNELGSLEREVGRLRERCLQTNALMRWYTFTNP
jgi:hypothetical protein